MNHKPMLAVDCGGIDNVILPLIASPKLDGVRAIIADGVVLSRSLKPIPNRHVQELLNGLPDGFDGELIVGDPTAPDAYRKTVSVVMSEDKPIDGLVYHLFDLQSTGGFRQRHILLRGLFNGLENTKALSLVPQVLVEYRVELLRLEAEYVDQGYEGLILRKPDSPYKHGRSGLKEGYLLKLKRFVDGEALVIGVTELMHNGNAATTNELGHTARSHKKEGLTGAGVMGNLIVRDIVTGVEFEIGTGFTAADRAEIWRKYHSNRMTKELYWPWVKYKHFPVGAKDKPRHPVFLGWRDTRDA